MLFPYPEESAEPQTLLAPQPCFVTGPELGGDMDRLLFRSVNGAYKQTKVKGKGGNFGLTIVPHDVLHAFHILDIILITSEDLRSRGQLVGAIYSKSANYGWIATFVVHLLIKGDIIRRPIS